MEEDRVQANLGPTADVQPEETEKAKQPKKRFVGRRTVGSAGKQQTSNGTIENSGAIQGYSSSRPRFASDVLILLHRSHSTSKTGKIPKSSS